MKKGLVLLLVSTFLMVTSVGPAAASTFSVPLPSEPHEALEPIREMPTEPRIPMPSFLLGVLTEEEWHEMSFTGGSGGDQDPYEKLAWTTIQVLIAMVLAGMVDPNRIADVLATIKAIKEDLERYYAERAAAGWPERDEPYIRTVPEK